MEYYPLGEYPQQKPQWLVDQLGKTPLYESRDVDRDLRVWLLDGTEDFSVPAAYLLQIPPRHTLFRHGHPCFRFEVVVQGSLEIGDGRVATPGDVFTANPGELYGPHTAGPEGCTTFEVFSSLDAMWDILVEDTNGGVRTIDSRAGEKTPPIAPLED